MDPPMQCNLCKKAVVEAARTLNIETVRTKSLVLLAGIAFDGCERNWTDPILIDVTYSILPEAINTSKNKKFSIQ